MTKREHLASLAKQAALAYAAVVAANRRRVGAGGAAGERAEDKARDRMIKAIDSLAAVA